jgi:hypothetical protein
LWVTDGTPQGTAEIFSLRTYGPIPFFQEVNGHLLFFCAYDYNATPFYRTDGTGAGTEIFRSFNASGHESSRDIEKMSITTIGDQIYFADHDGPANDGYPSEGEDYFQLMRSDGFETQSLRALGGGSYVGSDHITDLNGKIVFTTHRFFSSETDSRKRLWIYDPAKPFQSRGVLTLVDADTDQDIQTLSEGDVITRNANVNFNVRYDPPGDVTSVVFRHQDKKVRGESAPPYSLAGDRNGDYFIWSDGVAGRHKIKQFHIQEQVTLQRRGRPLSLTLLSGMNRLPAAVREVYCASTGVVYPEVMFQVFPWIRRRREQANSPLLKRQPTAERTTARASADIFVLP